MALLVLILVYIGVSTLESTCFPKPLNSGKEELSGQAPKWIDLRTTFCARRAWSLIRSRKRKGKGHEGAELSDSGYDGAELPDSGYDGAELQD